MYIEYDNQQNGFILIFDYSAEKVALVKELPRRKYRAETTDWFAWNITTNYPKLKEVISKTQASLSMSAERAFETLEKDYAESVKDSTISELETSDDFSLEGFGVNCFPFQIAGVKYALNKKKTFIADQQGLGKLQPIDTPILTPNGLSKMGKIKVGDRVIGSNGKPTKVTGVFPQGVKDNYYFYFSDGTKAESGKEHLWTFNYRCGGRRWKSVTLTTAQIIHNNAPIVNHPNGRITKLDLRKTLLYLPMFSNPVEYEQKDSLPIPAYTLGALIANGSLGHSTPTLVVNVDDKDDIRNSLIQDGIQFSERDYTTSHRFNILNSVSIIKELGLDVTSFYKFIPDCYKYASIKNRIALLQGLMDGDGSITKERNRITYHSIAYQLVKDVKELVECLGGIATIRTYDRSFENKPVEYQVRIKLPNDIKPFRIKRKAERHIPKNYSIPVRTLMQDEIKFSRSVESVCIAVDAPDRLYAVNNGILTHNTVQAIATVWKAQSYPCLVICPASLKINWYREIRKGIDGADVQIWDAKSSRVGQFIVINYENVQKQKEVLKSIGFQSIICDESQYCFDYDTLVTTNIGDISIGEIVEKKLPVFVKAFDFSNNAVKWNRVTNFWKNELRLPLVKVTHSKGNFICTENHKIWTGEKYVEAGSLKSGESLFVLPNGVYDTDKRESNGAFLQSEMLGSKKCGVTRISCKNIQSTQKTFSAETMRTLSKEICSRLKQKTAFLWKSLRGILAYESLASMPSEYSKGFNSKSYNQQRQKTTRCSGKNESQQSYEEPCNTRQNDRINEREVFCCAWRKRSTDKTANIVIRITKLADRIFDFYHRSKSAFRVFTNLLQSGFSDCFKENRYRSGRAFAQNEESSNSRQKENECLELSRVESVEIYERTSFGRNGSGQDGNSFVYDLEVEENHNYFANGVLVSNCKNPKSQRTKAVKDVSARIPYRLLLTGTAILNRPVEIIPQLDILGKLADLGGFHYFTKRYCNARLVQMGAKKFMDFSGATNLAELNEKLKAIGFVRRLKKDVLKELPDKTRTNIPTEISNRKEYAQAEQDVADFVGRRHAEEQDFVNSIKSLSAENQKLAKQKRYEDKVWQTEQAEQLVKIQTLKKLASLGKVDSIIEWVNTTIENDEKVIVFAHHTDIQQTLIKSFKGCAYVIGKDSMEDRQRHVDRFQNDPLCKVIVVSLQAGSTGITLTASTNVVFAEFAWAPSTMLQAEDRCLVGDSLIYNSQSANLADMSLQKIEDIQRGSYVLTHQGNIRRVSDTAMKEHRGMMTKISYVGWYADLTCTHDHKIFIRRNGLNQWIEAHQLLPSDSMAFPKPKNTKRLDSVEIKQEWRMYDWQKSESCIAEANCDMPITARSMCSKHYRKFIKDNPNTEKPKQINGRYKALPSKITITDEWLYLLGWYVAEGFATTEDGKGRFASFSGHAKERRTLEKIRATIKKDTGIDGSIYESKKTLSVELRVYNTELARWFREWFGHLAKNKSLPLEILNLPEDQAKIFLKGYTDGDGYERNNQVEWVSASQKLCYQMCLIAIRSGYIPTMRKVKVKSEIGFHWVGGYSINGKDSRLNEQDKDYIYRPIRNVSTYTDKVKVYDLTVEEDHSFVCGFASVHNCHRIGQKEMVNVWYFVGIDTIDEDTIEMLTRKAKTVEQVMDGQVNDGLETKTANELVYRILKKKGKI